MELAYDTLVGIKNSKVADISAVDKDVLMSKLNELSGLISEHRKKLAETYNAKVSRKGGKLEGSTLKFDFGDSLPRVIEASITSENSEIIDGIKNHFKAGTITCAILVFGETVKLDELHILHENVTRAFYYYRFKCMFGKNSIMVTRA